MRDIIQTGFRMTGGCGGGFAGAAFFVWGGGLAVWAGVVGRGDCAGEGVVVGWFVGVEGAAVW
ncbi:hypothetical protein GCM10023194_07800 [Planotetraspora phitsanulokensis]